MIIRGCVAIAVLATVAMVTTGLMCQFPHCDKVDCAPVDPKNCTGTVKMGGGYCGCCLACFTLLGESEVCERKDAIDSILYPPTALCKKGLYCEHNTSTCEPIPGYNYNFG